MEEPDRIDWPQDFEKVEVQDTIEKGVRDGCRKAGLVGQETDDVHQEVRLAIWLRREGTNFPNHESLFVYARSSARNNAKRRLGKTSRHKSVELDLTAVIAPVCSAEDFAVELEELERYIEKLPSKLRDAIRLRYFKNMTFEQIGVELGIALSTASLRVASGLNRIAVFINQDRATQGTRPWTQA